MTTASEAIAQLDAALASGEKSIEYNGRKIVYQDTTAMLAARQHFERLASAAPAGDPAPAERNRVTYASFARD